MPILNPDAFEFFSRSPSQTRRIGIRLGALLQPGDITCLSGNLGSGKTTLVQGMAQGWGSLNPATSPTFVLINEYARPDGCRLFHLDAYRIESSAEARDLDLDNLLEMGTLVVEWPERILDALPREHLWVDMGWMDELQRSMVFTPHGSRFQKLIKDFRRQMVGG